MKFIYEQYLNKLDYKEMPEFLRKYLNVPSLTRLKNIYYFCGMNYASKDIYNFNEDISRYDHSLNVALITWKLTHDKKATLAGLFHDISTPCFSHVIDFMNKDYEVQESTEEYTEHIIKSDKGLIEYLNNDNLEIDDIINFKKYSIVDNDRPKLCGDRLDGIILTGLYWVCNLNIEDALNIINDIEVFINEDNEEEIGFKSFDIGELAYITNNKIDEYCHSDNYMMQMLADITKRAIDLDIFSYEDLFILDEETIMNRIKNSDDNILKEKLLLFQNITTEDIPDYVIPNMKKRVLNPLVNGVRLK